MKKTILILLILLSLLFSSYKIVLAFNKNIILMYDGKSKNLVFLNSKPENLFSNFNDLMPGDTVEETIILRGKNINISTKFYLKFLIIQNESLVNKINFNIYIDEEKIPIEKVVTGSYVRLFDMKKNLEHKLKIVLNVPTSVGNEIAEIKQQIKWDFVVSEDGEVITPPNTSDNIIKYVLLFIISLLMLIYLLFSYKKTKKALVN